MGAAIPAMFQHDSSTSISKPPLSHGSSEAAAIELHEIHEAKVAVESIEVASEQLGDSSARQIVVVATKEGGHVRWLLSLVADGHGHGRVSGVRVRIGVGGGRNRHAAGTVSILVLMRAGVKL